MDGMYILGDGLAVKPTTFQTDGTLPYGEPARSFTATITGPDKLGLRQTLELFANEQWIADSLDDE